MSNVTVFVEFITESDLIRDIYKDDPFILRVVYDESNDGKTGSVFKNRKIDYPNENYISIMLTEDEFYNQYYLKHKYNPDYENIDLRVMYYLNRNEGDNYNIKYVRDSMYSFSTKPICQHYDYPDNERLHLKIACTNQGIIQKNNKLYCPDHVNI